MAQKDVTHCENCGTELRGEFCHVCGQRGVEIRRPVIGLAQDIIVETLAVDGRLLRTLKGLFINPGQVAKDYVDGHRMRYSPPFRIFLFFSLVYFFAFFSVVQSTGNASGPGASVSPVNMEVTGLETDAAPDVETPPQTPVPPQTDSGEEDSQGNETPDGPPPGVGISVDQNEDGSLNYNGPEFLRPYAEALRDNIEQAFEDPRLFMANIRELVPRVLLIMPAFYTLLLLAFYFYKPIYTYDVIVISLYMHAALYYYLLVAILLQWARIPFAIGDIGALIVQLFGMFQSYRVLRINFGSGWLSTVIKGSLINGIFWSVAMVVLLVGIVLSLY